jgi:trehalose 6-phosphate synthase
LSNLVDFHWFGWPDTLIHGNDRGKVERDLALQFNAVPIFLDKDIVENHYNGF